MLRKFLIAVALVASVAGLGSCSGQLRPEVMAKAKAGEFEMGMGVGLGEARWDTQPGSLVGGTNVSVDLKPLWILIGVVVAGVVVWKIVRANKE